MIGTLLTNQLKPTIMKNLVFHNLLFHYPNSINLFGFGNESSFLGSLKLKIPSA